MSKIFQKGCESLFIPPPEPKIMSSEEAFRKVWNATGNYMKEAIENYDKPKTEETLKATSPSKK